MPNLKFHVSEELLSWRATCDFMLNNALHKQTPYTAACTALQNSCSFHVFPCAFMCCFQSKFKSQGTKLIPDCAGSDNNCALIALIMQRVFEGNTLHQKIGMLTLYLLNSISLYINVDTETRGFKEFIKEIL